MGDTPQIVPTLIFDCDGVIADTEQFGHLPAFNQTFEEFGVPVQWTVDEYAQKVLIGGGKERMRSILTDELSQQLGLTSEDAKDEAILAWHKRKTAIYTELVDKGVMPARPGIFRVVQEAHLAGWGLAVASTALEPEVRAVLTHAVGVGLAAMFSIFAGDMVLAKKPAPDIYLLILDDLGLEPGEAIVVEDSANGLRAAVGAGLRTVVTISGFSRGEDLTGASLVVSSLGDPGEDDEPAKVLGNPFGIELGSAVTLQTFRQILDLPGPASPLG
ncbi:HAD-IA family hydrolase [Arthrobacter sp. CAN_C5]|uniref:HAD-IA family hydrolase n=1 Tax=Arthrobacter sp. CAN_C5 TaxID=2760706 RepID=UPI0028AFE878|nr:HAD-IA family hydrolase [Arthrobacter sp. CAN_C5]MBP2217965.1 HAD superfamily hydrolase (TIGR01509 family) [Arthrobacter sp. CAN_C5]